MVAFTLTNSGSTGGFYIRSHQEVMGWHGLPHDLDCEMEDVRRKGEKVEQLSTGLNGDWFLRTDRRLECKANEQHKSSNVKLFIRLMQRAGFSPEQYTIQFFTFVPDPKGYVAVLQKADGSNSKCVWQHVSQKLDELLRREAHNGVCHVTVGKNGSHVVILKNGIMFWSGVTESLSQRLYDARREGRAVVVSLRTFLDVRNSLTDLQINPSGRVALPHLCQLVFY
ncbi:hypothetical protein BC826DRAFT_74365 [Russula brevipes]|nr:hypothetical protein BC826DRAFT_74365 [Russula brevipes]